MRHGRYAPPPRTRTPQPNTASAATRLSTVACQPTARVSEQEHYSTSFLFAFGVRRSAARAQTPRTPDGSTAVTRDAVGRDGHDLSHHHTTAALCVCRLFGTELSRIWKILSSYEGIFRSCAGSQSRGQREPETRESRISHSTALYEYLWVCASSRTRARSAHPAGARGGPGTARPRHLSAASGQVCSLSTTARMHRTCSSKKRRCAGASSGKRSFPSGPEPRDKLSTVNSTRPVRGCMETRMRSSPASRWRSRVAYDMAVILSP